MYICMYRFLRSCHAAFVQNGNQTRKLSPPKRSSLSLECERHRPRYRAVTARCMDEFSSTCLVRNQPGSRLQLRGVNQSSCSDSDGLGLPAVVCDATHSLTCLIAKLLECLALSSHPPRTPSAHLVLHPGQDISSGDISLSVQCVSLQHIKKLAIGSGQLNLLCEKGNEYTPTRAAEARD
ncbi:hypothetical protein BD289DRAFT_154229 [Coniella lustricola]|uniref:Uncharacterized protein n=1 Tax=Coniella lustricola TaxID=2025994 RepID=A0A2T3AMF9_9PEZI|nr:hypothetical protein BD289DRAFT_154229 [Coniella lustricola]